MRTISKLFIIAIISFSLNSCSKDSIDCQDVISEINSFYNDQLNKTTDQQQINNIMREYTLALSNACD